MADTKTDTNTLLAAKKTSAENTAAALGMSSAVLEWLLAKGGPIIAEWLLKLLSKHSDAQGVLPTAFGVDIFRDMIVDLIDQYKVTLIDQIASVLESQGNLFATMVATVIRQYGTQIVDMLLERLRTPEGLQALEAAIAKQQ